MILSKIRSLKWPVAAAFCVFAMPANSGLVSSSTEVISFEYDQEFGQIDAQVRACPPFFWGKFVSGSGLRKQAMKELRARVMQFQRSNSGVTVRPLGSPNSALETSFTRSAQEGNRCTVIDQSYSVDGAAPTQQVAATNTATTATSVPAAAPAAGGVLRVGIRDGYGMIAQKVGEEWTGAAPLFASMIGQELGRTVQFVPLANAKQRMTAPKYGAADIVISLVSYTDERAGKATLSEPYFSTGLVAAALDPGSVEDVTTWSGFNDAGYTFIVAKGTTAESFVKETYPSAKVKVVSKTADIPAEIDRLRAGDAAADDDVLVVTDETIAAMWPVMVLELEDKRLHSNDDYVVVIKRGDGALVDAVNKTIITGDIATMYADLAGQ